MWPKNMQKQDLILRKPARIHFWRGLEDDVTLTLTNLRPFSNITVQVRVLNKHYAGPPSSLLYVHTSEGLPGPPAMLAVTSTSSTHLELEWKEPYEKNGILLGYKISYRTADGLILGEMTSVNARIGPEKRSFELRELSPGTVYRVYIKAGNRSRIWKSNIH